MESILLQVLAIVIGACIGSFLNVVVYRVPAGLSILFPPSRCPHCLKKLSSRDNIPILGWFLIRGKCRYCHTKVSWRYPAVEALTAILFWSVAFHFGFSQPWYVLLFYGAFLSWLLALTLIDLDTMTLPNQITQSGLVLGLIYQSAIAFEPTVIPYAAKLSWGSQILVGVTGAVVGIWLLDIVRWLGRFFLGKEAMGAGDAKLAAMMGAWLGWQHLLLAILLAATVGSILGLFAVATKVLGREQPFPFGPFLAMGGALSLFWGSTIISTYLGWFGIN
ncbi:prepilin peptidase [Tumidithrix elongata RA019]|uniref:Prepilin peptidase n=1 Tax=Tumidithrix elongata BACA0141 TaxID=2716417 RepID=A0AAW9Q7T9_9CYAN|nr:prepilin peptidase [Tumidithrix elongata RA019]